MCTLSRALILNFLGISLLSFKNDIDYHGILLELKKFLFISFFNSISLTKLLLLFYLINISELFRVELTSLICFQRRTLNHYSGTGTKRCARRWGRPTRVSYHSLHPPLISRPRLFLLDVLPFPGGHSHSISSFSFRAAVNETNVCIVIHTGWRLKMHWRKIWMSHVRDRIETW